MKTRALVVALFVARAIVLWGRPVPWSPAYLAACLGQDALVALAFLVGEAAVSRWHAGRRVVSLAFWVTVGYVALNVVVARVLPTPLTWPMIRAAGAPIADSIQLYATWSAGLGAAGVLLSATLTLRVTRGMPGMLVPLGTVLLLLGGAGLWARGHVETWGLHRNAVLTLAASVLPVVALHEDAGEHAADAHWRMPHGEVSPPADLSALSGIAAGRNVVVIGLESVGAPYLKMYGAADNVMPRIDDLAAHALVFERAYAVSPDSIRSLFSVLCSRYPAFDTPVDAYASGRCASLAARLQQHGYHTALFHSGRFGYLGMAGVIRDRGFDVLEDAGHIGGQHESSFGVEESATVNRILSWVDSLPSSARFALTYLPVAGHHPYVFSGDGAFGAATDLDRYRSALSEGDGAIGLLIDGLRARGLFEQTMFVVYGDHGQAFEQHPGNVGHTFYLYEENVRVPLYFSIPGAMARARRSDLTMSLVDVTPTALDLLGVRPDDEHQGRTALGADPRTALFFTDYGESLVGLRDGGWKFIHDLRSGRSRLFDLEIDPGEQHDLSAAAEARVEAYVQDVRAWSTALKAEFAAAIRTGPPRRRVE